ncbi:MAG: glycoside hydrolase family 130 protein [Lentisphaeria bacterium]|nr:glycoside hydrolase family 130 protein [Lentisphaeria bacterium]
MKQFTTPACIKRHPANPILSAADIPYEATLTFNAGVTKFNGEYVMVFRNDYGSPESVWRAWSTGESDERPGFETTMGLAFSSDGVTWQVRPDPCFAMKDQSLKIRRAYDPRLTVIDGRCHMCFAVDTFYGVRGGIAVTDDFETWEVLSMTVPDNRNMVLLPEKINGKYVRFERPFPVYGRGGGEAFDFWMSDSPDLKYWGNSKLVLGAERVPFSNAKIGPGAPPVKTPKGWLTTFHATYKDNALLLDTWEKEWHKAYHAGIMLLDLADPSKIIGICDNPILPPEETYELNGFRGSVIFPGGMILEDSGEVKIYYGGADTVECLATADVNDLIALCLD